MYHKKRVIKTIIIIISIITISAFIGLNTHKIITKHLENQKEIDKLHEEDKNKKKGESSSLSSEMSVNKENTSKNIVSDKESNKKDEQKPKKKTTSKNSNQKKEIATPDAPDISKINNVTKKENVPTTINENQQLQTNASPIEKTNEIAKVTFKGKYFDEEIYALVEMNIIGEFDTNDLYIRKLTYKLTYDYSMTYEPFTDEVRREIENEMKKVAQEEYNGFTITASSSGNVIQLTLMADYDRLKKHFPEEFTENGEFYYNNFVEELKKMADE